jgi:hypothetical protein
MQLAWKKARGPEIDLRFFGALGEQIGLTHPKDQSIKEHVFRAQFWYRFPLALAKNFRLNSAS